MYYWPLAAIGLISVMGFRTPPRRKRRPANVRFIDFPVRSSFADL